MINIIVRSAPIRISAYTKVLKAINEGVIIKPTICSRCGSNNKIEGHHQDYFKPLELQWFCHSCHMLIHKFTKEKRNNNLVRYYQNHPGITYRALGAIFKITGVRAHQIVVRAKNKSLM